VNVVVRQAKNGEFVSEENRKRVSAKGSPAARAAGDDSERER